MCCALQVRPTWGMQPVSSGSVVAGSVALIGFGVLGVALRLVAGSTPTTVSAASVGAGVNLAVLWRSRSSLHVWALHEPRLPTRPASVA
jgi:hypothetical protein